MAYRVDPGRAPECFEYEVIDPDTQTLVKMRSGFMLASEGVTIPSTVTITGDYTVKATDRSVLVNTAAAVTITLPADLPVGTPLGITRIVSSANAITVARSGSELIEGAATFVTHGAWAAATLNLSEVVLKKIDATNWRFVGGEISGSNANGSYTKKSNGEMKCKGNNESRGPDGSRQSYSVQANCYNYPASGTFPMAFVPGSQPIMSLVSAYGIIGYGGLPTATGYNNFIEANVSLPSGIAYAWSADGRWRA